MNTIISLRVPTEKLDKQKTSLELHFEKHRDFEACDAQSIYIELGKTHRGGVTFDSQPLDAVLLRIVERLMAYGYSEREAGQHVGLNFHQIAELRDRFPAVVADPDFGGFDDLF